MSSRRVVVITGAGGAIGQATARAMATLGCDLVLADVDEEAASAIAAECEALGSHALGIGCDLTSSANVDELAAAALQSFQQVDVLVNLAGIWPLAAIETMSDEHWEKVLAVNLTGVFYSCRAMIPALRSQRGVIVNVASGMAFRPAKQLAAYAASKGGLVAFSRVLALELAPEVRVNVVAPGPTESPTHDSDRANSAASAALLAAVTADIPLGRLAHPEEAADAIVFAASEQARFMTGNVLHVNGGRLMP